MRRSRFNGGARLTTAYGLAALVKERMRETRGALCTNVLG